MAHEARMQRGIETVKRLGRDTMPDQKALYPDLQALSVGHLFGDIWTRPHLDLRTRTLITLAANIALARPQGNQAYYRSAMHIGITKEQIMEVIIHVGQYAGWLALDHASNQFSAVLKEDGIADANSILPVTEDKTTDDYEDSMKQGFETLRQMGCEGVMQNQKDLYPDLYNLSVGYLFGEIWSRPHLTLRERELITMASNIALARSVGTHTHYRIAQHIGITKEEIMELIIQVGHYAGWPAMALATVQFSEVLKADAAKTEQIKAP